MKTAHYPVMVVISCVALLLSGCAGPGTQKTPEKTATANHAATPAATPSATPPSDLLFTISAKVRSASGATIGIRLAAHSPLAASDRAATDLVGEFLDLCGDGVGGTPMSLDSMVSNGGILLRLDLTSTTEGEDFVSPLDLYLGSNYSAKAASGDGILAPPASNGCMGTYSWTRSGTAHGIAEFENGSSSPDLGNWRYGLYGFAVQSGSNATIESCTITMTALATAANIKDVSGWQPQDTSGTTCITGYVGE